VVAISTKGKASKALSKGGKKAVGRTTINKACKFRILSRSHMFSFKQFLIAPDSEGELEITFVPPRANGKKNKLKVYVKFIIRFS
jgi:hypothetical protein